MASGAVERLLLFQHRQIMELRALVDARHDQDVAGTADELPLELLSLVVSTHQDRGAHIIVSSKDYEDLILDIIMAHTDELAAHPDKYVKFLRAIYRAIDYFYANQEESI